MILGLSTGLLKKILKFEEIISLYKEIGCSAIELAPLHWKLADRSLSEDFDYISVHTESKFRYADNAETHDELKLLEQKHLEIGFKCVVIHPTAVEDWDVLKSYKLPWAVENMDSRNKIGTTPGEILKLSGDANFNVVLDLNHCFTHDISMKLAEEFYETLGDKIIELHISGYKDSTPEGRHIPLYFTKQINIIKKAKNLPMMIEGSLETEDSVRKEFKYLTQMIKKQ